MSIPDKRPGEDPRKYVKRVLRALRKQPRFKLTPLSRLGQAEEELDPIRVEAQRVRAMAGLEPELPESGLEREAFDEDALEARRVWTSEIIIPLFGKAFGDEYTEVLTDPDVIAHYLPFMASEHPYLATHRVMASPLYDWIAACLAWLTRGDMNIAPPTGDDLKRDLIDHAYNVMEAVALRPKTERQAEIAAAIEAVPLRERKTIESRWREGQWEGEKPVWSTGFMRPDDPRFWEFLRDEEKRRAKWERIKAERARKRARRKEFVITKGPGGVVTAGPRRKRRKKPKRRK
jgi:hypothetical protein